MINHENEQRSLVFFGATCVVSAGISVVVTEWFMSSNYMFDYHCLNPQSFVTSSAIKLVAKT